MPRDESLEDSECHAAMPVQIRGEFYSSQTVGSGASSGENVPKQRSKRRATTQRSIASGFSSAFQAMRGARPLGGLLKGRRKKASLSHIGLKDETLCRGVPLRIVLQHMGARMRSSQGTARDYQRSTQELTPSAFLSHNWAVSAFAKFLAFAFYFNFWPALFMSLLAQTLLFCLAAANQLPMFEDGIESMNMARGPWCVISGMVIFWVTLLFRHHICPWLGWPECRVFLDKMCIDQVDSSRRQQGINSIGAVLAPSELLVVALSPLYFKRLWTVFEFCTFVATHDLADLKVQPVWLAKVSTLGCGVTLITLIGERLLGVYDFDSAFGAMSLLTTAFLFATFALALRYWGRVRNELSQQANSFRISTALCHEESDRVHVTDAVACFARDARIVVKHAGEREAVAAFEEQVRLVVPEALAVALGRTGVPVRYALTVLLPLIGSLMDDVSSTVRQTTLCSAPPGESTRHVLGMLISSGCRVTLCLVGIGCSSWVAGQQMHLTNVSEVCWIVFIMLLLLLPIVIIGALPSMNLTGHPLTWTNLAVNLAILLVSAAAAACMHHRAPKPQLASSIASSAPVASDSHQKTTPGSVRESDDASKPHGDEAKAQDAPKGDLVQPEAVSDLCRDATQNSDGFRPESSEAVTPKLPGSHAEALAGFLQASEVLDVVVSGEDAYKAETPEEAGLSRRAELCDFTGRSSGCAWSRPQSYVCPQRAYEQGPTWQL